MSSYVVEGSVRKSGDRVQITAQLNDVSTGSHIWAERYDRDLLTSSRFRTRSPNPSSPRSNLSSTPRKIFAPGASRPAALDAWDLVMRALSHYW